MPTSVRLDRRTEELLRRTARAAGRSVSWVVREAVAAYAADAPASRAPFEVLSPFIGVGTTGQTTLSDGTGARFTEIVRSKARRRRAR